MPLQMHAALENGQNVNVIVAVLDDMGTVSDTVRRREENVAAPAAPYKSGKKGRRAAAESWRKGLDGHERDAPVRSFRRVDFRCLCTEDGCVEACRQMSVSENMVYEYAHCVRGNLGMLSQTRHGSRFICAMIGRLPYGRQAAFESDADRIFAEVIDSLPRAAMQATGKSVFLALLTKADQEGVLPSKTTRTLVERLSQYLAVMVQCSHASQVLVEAFKVKSVRKVLEASVVDLVGDICKTPPGCSFLLYALEDLRSEEVAMAIVESRECFRSLSWDTVWCKILVLAGGFGHLHRSQLSERVRRASLEEQQRCTREVKLAALWKK